MGAEEGRKHIDGAEQGAGLMAQEVEGNQVSEPCHISRGCSDTEATYVPH